MARHEEPHAPAKRNRRRIAAVAAGVAVSATGLAVTSQSAFADTYGAQVYSFTGSTAQGMSFGSDGTFYIANTSSRSIDRVDAGGGLTPIVSSDLTGAQGVQVDASGGVYIADTYNTSNGAKGLLKYWNATTHVVSTLDAAVYYPRGMAMGADGDIYIAEGVGRIDKWDPATSTLTTVVSGLSNPTDVDVAPDGDLYIADQGNHRIALFDAATSQVSTLVDGVSYPIAVTLDAAGDVFYGELNSETVREHNATTGTDSTLYQAQNNVYGLEISPAGDLYMTDDNSIRKLVPFTAPSVPLNLSATAGDGSIGLTFDAPADTGGTDVTGYEVSSDGGATWSPLPTDGSGPFTATVSGLANGTPYALQVRADNSVGAGPIATAASTTPDVAPTAPGPVTAVAGKNSIDLSFTAPADNGGTAVTGYQVSTDGGVSFSPLKVDDSGSVITATVSGLTHGTDYAVQVRAVNGAGTGAATTANVVDPTGVPSAPRAVASTPGNASLAVEFQAPADNGGLAITGYQTSIDDGDTWVDATVTGDDVLDTTVTGLTNGTLYTVEVRALNADGASAAGIAGPKTPVTVAGAPTVIRQLPENGSIQLSFAAPDDGGSPISYYQVSTDGGATWNYALPYQDNPLTVNVSGLTNGTSYRLQLRALNDVGDGAAVTAAAATPSTTPDAPTGVTAVSGDASATVSFTPPADDGGAAIFSYQYSVDGDTWHTFADLVANFRMNVVGGQVHETVTGLTNGQQYALQVRAVNVQGGGDASDPVSVSPKAPAAPVTLNGPTTRVVAAGTTVTISGTATAGSTVSVYFRERGQTAYTLRRSIRASAHGTYSTTYTADDDYRYYAQVGATKTDAVLTQVGPTVAGPVSRTVVKKSTVVLTGTGVAGSTVVIHFHKAGTAADDYSLLRTVTVAGNGTWTRSIVADVDYRFYVTSGLNGIATANYLVQTR